MYAQQQQTNQFNVGNNPTKVTKKKRPATAKTRQPASTYKQFIASQSQMSGARGSLNQGANAAGSFSHRHASTKKNSTAGIVSKRSTKKHLNTISHHKDLKQNTRLSSVGAAGHDDG